MLELIDMADAPIDTPTSFEDESWDRAKKIAVRVGKTPALFTTCIRAINKVESVVDTSDDSTLQAVAVDSATFLVRVSPTLQSVFYAGAERLHPEALAALTVITVPGLLNIFNAREIASILGVTYLYRRAAKRCDKDEWEILSKKLLAHTEIACLIGARMQHIGVGNGIFLGSIRYLAAAALAINNLKSYQSVKKKKRKANQVFNSKAEMETFGCNHLQVAAQLATELGYVTPRSPISIGLGMEAIHVDPTTLSPKLREHVISWRAAMEYVETLHATGLCPKELESDYSLSLSDSDQKTLEASVASILRNGSTFTWLDTRWNDLPAEVQAQLPGSKRIAKTSTKSEGVTDEDDDD